MNRIQIILSFLAAASAVLYPAYTLLIRRRSLANAILLAAFSVVAFLEIFDLLSMLKPEQLLFWKRYSLVAEGALPFVWLLFSLVFARNDVRAMSLLQRGLLIASLAVLPIPIIFPVNIFFYSPDFISEPVLFLSSYGVVFYSAVCIGLISALINLEATFVHASGIKRWNIKFEIIGTGLLLAGLFAYYGHSFLYRTISMNLISVRSVLLLLAVTLVAYSQSRSKEHVRVYVSRGLAYKSVVLLSVGVYLVVLGLLGEGMKYFNDSFVKSIGISLSVVLGAVLMILIFSESLKRKIQVFLGEHFYQNKYDYRSEWLSLTDKLSSPRSVEELSSAIVAVFCETFGMACGALYLRLETADNFSLLQNHEMISPTALIKGSDPFMRILLSSRTVSSIRSLHLDSTSELAGMFSENRVSFAIPLSSSDQVIGFIVAGQPLFKLENYSSEDYDLMNTIAHQAAAALLTMKLSEQLAQAREIEVLGKISTFMIHDLKNQVHTLSLLVSNAKEYISDPEFQADMLASLENTTGRMNALIGKFKNMPVKSDLRLERVDLLQLAVQVATGMPGSDIRVSGCSVYVMIDQEQIKSLLVNLFLNAIEATDGIGPVQVETGSEHNRAFVSVTDHGCGIPDDFLRQHLFAAFKTTKKSGLGIGLFQCRQIAEAHDGTIRAVSRPDEGAVFTLQLPLVTV
ncbi:MAG: PEP-CTERM system histidine kinase PrsK [Geobacteraceae bacterium]|nr:PEP-CTERM system histidine kinase PrsK [Geobacteraceae bacterium]